jgi:hypothetical protein
MDETGRRALACRPVARCERTWLGLATAHFLIEVDLSTEAVRVAGARDGRHAPAPHRRGPSGPGCEQLLRI